MAQRYGKWSSLALRCNRRQSAACRACAAGFLLVLLCHAETSRAQNNEQNRPLVIPRLANEPPDANAIMKMHQARSNVLAYEAANAERKRQLAQEAEILLRLATEVKQEVDRRDAATLPYTSRKTELIERLAKDMQEKMKLTIPVK